MKILAKVRDSSIKTKILGLSISILTLCLFSTVVWVKYVVTKETVNDSKQFLSDQMKFASGAVKAGVYSEQVLCKSIMSNYYKHAITTKVTEEYLDLLSTSGKDVVATFFIKQGSDYIRTITTVKKEDGLTRATGTKLDPEGRAYKALSENKEFNGIVPLFKKRYYVSYKPLADGNVLFVGVPLEATIANISKMMELKVGKTGYFYVIETHGREKGELLVHPAKVGSNIFESKDADGKQFIKEMIEKKEGVIIYPWQNPGEPKARKKMVVYATEETTGWLIGGGTYLDEMEDQANLLVFQLSIAILATLILVSLGIYFVVGRVLKPLGQLIEVSEKVASGDLTQTLEITSKDEIGTASLSFNKMIENLRSLIFEISEASTQVASSASQLQATAEQIATGAEEVAAQAMTVATAGEEMSATAADIASNCQHLSDGSNQASEVTKSGFKIVTATVEGIKFRGTKTRENADIVQSLGKRSEQIGEIIATIEDIADQTNLLALNAAIEAARAGEQGRGFAVVADEVRALAARTSTATKEISSMIKGIQEETKVAIESMEAGVAGTVKGAEEAQQLELSLTEILDQIMSVAQQVSQIATAAEEQTATTREISANIIQITDVVGVTAQGANESASAASQLNSNAESLQRLVAQFKL